MRPIPCFLAAAAFFAAGVAALLAADPAHGRTSNCDLLQGGCPTGFDLGDDECANNETIVGETCARRLRAWVQSDEENTYPNDALVHAFSDGEISRGNVHDLNTFNDWVALSSGTELVVLGNRVTLGAYVYASSQEPPGHRTGQLEVVLSPGTDATGGLPFGVVVQHKDLWPVWCYLETPLGRQPVDCRLAPVRSLLP